MLFAYCVPNLFQVSFNSTEFLAFLSFLSLFSLNHVFLLRFPENELSYLILKSIIVRLWFLILKSIIAIDRRFVKNSNKLEKKCFYYWTSIFIKIDIIFAIFKFKKVVLSKKTKFILNFREFNDLFLFKVSNSSNENTFKF